MLTVRATDPRQCFTYFSALSLYCCSNGEPRDLVVGKCLLFSYVVVVEVVLLAVICST